MFGTENLALFIVSGLLLNLTPGQDTLYIVGRSIAQGRRAGILSALGISSGCVVHTLAAAIGLSAILATSASAFFVVKMAGAAYLVYLGGRMVFARSSPTEQPTELSPHSNGSIFWSGFLTNLLNPKVAIFFMAFLPHFVAPDAQSKIVAFLFLGAVFIFNGTLWCLCLACSASSLSRRYRMASTTAGSVIRRTVGALFVGLGLKLAFSR